MDLVGCDVLEGGVLHTHGHVEREAPDLVVARRLLPVWVPEVRLHERKLVAVSRLDHAVEAVHTLAIVVLLDLWPAVLVADEGPTLPPLGLGLLLGRLTRLVVFQVGLLLALALELILQGGAAHICHRAGHRQVGLVLLLLVVRLVERL